MAVYLGTNEVNFRGGRPSEVTSVNGETGDVVLDIPEKTSDLINDSGFLTSAPVSSVNGKTGAVTVVEGLEPLIGTTATVTPQQVMTALEEGRDICISATGEIARVPLVLKFTNFNRATDSAYAGNAIDVVLSQTIAAYSGAFYLFELVGGTLSMNPHPWEIIQTNLATLSDLNREVSGLWNNFADYVPTVREVNGKALSADITLTASDVGALPDSTVIPSKTSDLTNDSGFIIAETDPTVPAWAKASSKPTYTASEVGALSGNAGGLFYGTCSTAAGTVAKVVECGAFTADNLKAGTIIVVSFSATNSGAVASLTMNVNSTGAKPIKYINNGTLGNLSSAGYLKASTEYPFYYDGANWVVVFNVNSTYSALTEADMKAGTATTGRLITAARLKQAVRYHAPVTSVNGNNGDVTLSTSDLTNNGDGTSRFVTLAELAIPTFCATDATTQAVLQQAFGASADVVVPSGITSTATLLPKLEPRTWFCWMNGTEMEFARLSVSANAGTSTITLYLRGRTSIATGEMGVDSSWTVTPTPSVPTAVSELTNDSGYLTLSDLPIYNGGVS